MWECSCEQNECEFLYKKLWLRGFKWQYVYWSWNKDTICESRMFQNCQTLSICIIFCRQLDVARVIVYTHSSQSVIKICENIWEFENICIYTQCMLLRLLTYLLSTCLNTYIYSYSLDYRKNIRNSELF